MSRYRVFQWLAGLIVGIILSYAAYLTFNPAVWFLVFTAPFIILALLAYDQVSSK